jgi:hypothetical protein
VEGSGRAVELRESRICDTLSPQLRSSETSDPQSDADLAVLLMLCGEFVKSGGFRESCRAQGELSKKKKSNSSKKLS